MSNSASTKTRCKPGDRARIINYSAENNGRIVVVVRRYLPGEEISGHDDWMIDGPAWVVASVSQPLRCFMVRNGMKMCEFPTVATLPCEDSKLIPLLDDEGGIEQAKRRAPSKNRKAVA